MTSQWPAPCVFAGHVVFSKEKVSIGFFQSYFKRSENLAWMILTFLPLLSQAGLA